MNIIYPANLTVSVWVGTFASEDAFDKAVEASVTPQLRLPTHIASVCEVSYEASPVPIAQLLDGFSGCHTFSIAAINAALARNHTSANAALVCYYVSCKAAPEQWGDLAFLGSFAGSDHNP